MTNTVEETNEITKDYYNELVSFLKAAQESADDNSVGFPHAQRILKRTEVHLNKCIQELELISGERFGSPSVGDKMKDGLAKASSGVTSLFSGIGEHTDSKVLRNNYSSLQAASCGFQMLYTTEVAGYGESATSENLLSMIKDHHELVMHYGEVIPQTVAHELSLEDEATFGTGRTDIIVEKLKSTWR